MDSKQQVLKWYNDFRFLENDNRIILINLRGEWLKISKECFQILNEAIQKEMSRTLLLSVFESNEDCMYFSKLLTKLSDMQILEDKTFAKENPKLNIYWVITNRCNLKCAHCCISANEYIVEDNFSTSEMFNIADKIIELNPYSITISGGEPLVREDVYEILQYLSSKYNGIIILMSNGILIDESTVCQITPYVTNIDISIDGIDEESCSLIRGKGVFSRALKSVELLQQHNFNKISLSMVFGSKNMYMLDDFIELNKKHNTKAVPRLFAALGRGENVTDIYIEKKLPDTSFEELSLTDGSISKDLTAGRCDAINNGFTIDYTGLIYPCSLLIRDKYIIGDIKEIDSLKKWYCSRQFNKNNYDNFLELYPQNFPKCKECNVNVFCWGCLEVLDRLSNDCAQWERKCKRID